MIDKKKHPKTEHHDEKVVSCNGGDFGGHPKIYIRLRQGEPTICPYCGQKLNLPEES